jgi:peptidoglycan hydrolase-like protein with peptidoglycan-binding domain
MTNDQQLKAATQEVRKLLSKGDILGARLGHDDVRTLQHSLNQLGFRNSSPDGAFGPSTAQDAMDFLTQRSQRGFLPNISPHTFRLLNENGQAESLKTMMSEQVHILLDSKKPLTKEETIRLQRGLEYATGQDLGTPDGVIGKNSLEVLHGFISEYDRTLIKLGTSIMVDMNGSIFLNAEDDMIERFVTLAQRVPDEKRIAYLHEHADDILKGDNKRGGHDDGLIAQGQLILRSLGYAAGPVDGLVGENSQTRQALQEFLQDHPAPAQDAFVGQTTSMTRDFRRAHEPLTPPGESYQPSMPYEPLSDPNRAQPELDSSPLSVTPKL